MNSFMKKALSLLMVLCLVVLTVGLSVKVNAATKTFEKVELSDISATDRVIIVGSTSEKSYAIVNDKGTSEAPTAVEVTITDNKIVTNATNIFWNISYVGGELTIYKDGTNNEWLYCTDNNNGVRVGNNTNKIFTIADGFLKNKVTSRYVGVYVTKPDWRCYTSINNNISGQTFSFYKEISLSYTVNFDDGSGTVVSTLTNVPNGSKINAPTDPTKENYAFDGWYNGETKWDFAKDTVTSNLTLTAKWVSVLQGNLNAVEAVLSLGYKYDNQITIQSDTCTITPKGSGALTASDYDGRSINSVINCPNGFNVVFNKNSSGNLYASSSEFRLYTGSNGNGGSFVISSNLYEITACEITYNSTNKLTCSIVDGVLTVKNETSVRVDFSSIKLTYNKTSYQFSNVDFRLRCGIDNTISLVVDGLTGATYGIEVSDGTKTRTYSPTKEYYHTGDDSNYDYVIISLGDVLNNPERLDTEFTVRAFVEYDGQIYYSNKTKTYSVVTLVKEYLKDTAVASQIEGFKNILEGFGKTFE